MEKYEKISEIKVKGIPRLKTGFEELDWLYGKTIFSDKITTVWGFPQKTLSLWAGEGGVGKSRTTISVAKKLVSRGNRVLYFQNEVDLGTFAGWVKGDNSKNIDKFYCSNAVDLKTQMEIIDEISPHIVFVDSINQIEEFKSGSKQNIKNMIEGYNGIEGYRPITSRKETHVVFISQLNQDGSVKGSTTLSHLVDIVMKLEREKNSDLFRISVGSKHRYGPSGPQYYSLWKHTDAGVECVSSNRLKDEHWCNSHGLVVEMNDVAPIEPEIDTTNMSENMKWFYEQVENPDPYIPIKPEKKENCIIGFIRKGWFGGE